MAEDWQERPRCDEAPAWAALAQEKRRFVGDAATFDLRAAFASDAQRAQRFALRAPQVFADLSKNLWDEPVRALLTQLAAQCRIEQWRDAMLAGARVNMSEQRPATHVHWRWAPELPAAVEDCAIDAINLQETRRTLDDMLAYAEQVRADAAITDVVNIGIGGSDLGPRLLAQAFAATGAADGPRVHFVSNMDGHQMAQTLRGLRAESTLFIVVSKTFGTAETMQNAASARQWFEVQGGRGKDDVARHFTAVSANTEAAARFGAGRCFGFDAGVGGRYSLWSPVGLAVAIAAGAQAFEALRRGARAMDEHFTAAPLADNLPVQLALLDVWQRNFLRLSSRCIAPYHHGLRSLPAYLQQLEMESNGKRVDAHGRTLPFASAPVTWGQVGTNGQHAFFQALHQGSDVVPVEFVLVRRAAHSLPGHHEKLLANALAQSRALMLGQEGDAPERHFPGNRPSTTLLLPDADAASLGALLALCEHRTAALGALWGVNSFDQWGVELGKRHAGDIADCLQRGGSASMDASTAMLLGSLCT